MSFGSRARWGTRSGGGPSGLASLLLGLLGGALSVGCTPWERPASDDGEASVAEVEVDDGEANGGGRLPSPLPELLIEQANADGSITAEWWGEAPHFEPHESPFPLEYGIEELVFRFRGDVGSERFTPSGKLYNTDWRTNIFSPDGRRVVLAQDRFGPYHVIMSDRLREYLRGEPPDLEIGWEPSSPTSFVPVHGPVRWLGPRTIEVLYESETPEWRRYELP